MGYYKHRLTGEVFCVGNDVAILEDLKPPHLVPITPKEAKVAAKVYDGKRKAHFAALRKGIADQHAAKAVAETLAEGKPPEPEEPEKPETPEVQEEPEVPEVQEEPEVPEVQEEPEVPEVQEEPEVPASTEPVLPDVGNMNKTELIAFARNNGIEIKTDLLVADMREAVLAAVTAPPADSE